MPFTTITINDLQLLRQFRVSRLRNFFAEDLAQVYIHVDWENKLSFLCPTVPAVNALLDEIEDLRHYSWLILGIKTISIYLVME